MRQCPRFAARLGLVLAVAGCQNQARKPEVPKPTATPPAVPVAGCGPSSLVCQPQERCVFDRCMRLRGQVALGRSHACYLSPGGTVACWGDNTGLQLGVKGVERRFEPTQVDGLKDVVQIAAGDWFSCALNASGEVWCWGDNREAILDLPPVDPSMSWHDPHNEGRRPRSQPVRIKGLDAVRLSAGANHACAVLANGSVWCWGNNHRHRLANGRDEELSKPGPVLGVERAIEVAAGDDHSCAVVQTGEVLCWGSGSFGKLGNGTNDDAPLPVKVSSLTDAVAVSVFNDTSCAVRRGGSVACWGSGPLGNGEISSSAVPVQVTGVTDATGVAVGSSHVCMGRANGQVACFGNQASGELGHGPLDGQLTKLVPVAVQGIVDAVGVAARAVFRGMDHGSV